MEYNRLIDHTLLKADATVEQRIIASHGAYRVTPGELHQEILKLKKVGERKLKENFYDPVLLDQHISSNTKKVLEKWRRRKC